MSSKKKSLDSWIEKYNYSKSKFQSNLDRYERENEIYEGKAGALDVTTRGRKSKVDAKCFRNIVFELIETQINNAIPFPKVIPVDADNVDLALNIEGYLKLQSDRIRAEDINDTAERGILKHGAGYYHVMWDEKITTPITRGDLVVKYYPIDKVFPQPGNTELEDCEWIIVEDLVSIKKLKQLYGVTVPEDPEYREKAKLYTAWYFNDKNNVCRFGWVEDVVVFDQPDYYVRKLKVCKDCDTHILHHKSCPTCDNDKFVYRPIETEIMEEDIIEIDIETQEERLLVRAGDEVPYYNIDQLPFVLRRNISKEKSLYGLSDITILEQNQDSLNKIMTKMEENVLKAGSFLTKPKGVNLPLTDETLKVVTVNDPRQADAFRVHTVQANMQQDNILQDSLYKFAREMMGITDSYQGKRDPTAESGKAKEISAAQASGRMESKRRMKDSAYAKLYQLMFKFLLAYCDEPRTFSRITPEGEYIDARFSRYNFINIDDEGKPYYTDRFFFSVDSASILSTSREAMWQETTRNLQIGTFGNPQDPMSLKLYWSVMKGLGYPLASQALASLHERAQQLPMELQQAIMQNPEVLNSVRDQLAGGDENETG